jgi:predicted amidophosphoribosyltransferase
MGRHYVGIFLAGAFILLVTMLTLRLTRTKSDDRVERSGMCPDCGQPLQREGAPCPYCSYKKILEHQGVDTTRKRSLTPAGKLGIAAGVMAVLLIFLYGGQLRSLLCARVNPAAYRVIRCKGCKRKLRYLKAHAGGYGTCPTCKEKCEFPAVETDAANTANGG